MKQVRPARIFKDPIRHVTVFQDGISPTGAIDHVDVTEFCNHINGVAFLLDLKNNKSPATFFRKVLINDRDKYKDYFNYTLEVLFQNSELIKQLKDKLLPVVEPSYEYFEQEWIKIKNDPADEEVLKLVEVFLKTIKYCVVENENSAIQNGIPYIRCMYRIRDFSK